MGHNLPKDFETLVGNCLAHARREFVVVVNSFPAECRRVLETLRDVYRHDAEARERGLSDGERLSYHQDHSAPRMDGLKDWMDQQGRHNPGVLLARGQNRSSEVPARSVRRQASM